MPPTAAGAAGTAAGLDGRGRGGQAEDPEFVMLVDELPRTSSGKVRKDVLPAARKTDASG